MKPEPGEADAARRLAPSCGRTLDAAALVVFAVADTELAGIPRVSVSVIVNVR